MLLLFQTKNYRSFENKMTFSMEPAPKQKDLAYSVLKKEVKGKVKKALCSSVIYGPNAAGKSNVIGAMDLMRQIVLRGNILDCKERLTDTGSPASCFLQLAPNIKHGNEPLFFIWQIFRNQLCIYQARGFGDV